MLGGEGLGLFSCHSSFIGLITFRSDEHSGDTSFTVLFDGCDPASNRLKCLGLGEIEADHHTLGLLVEGHSERLEAFLASRIPDLQVILLVGSRFRVDILRDEIHTEGGHMNVLEAFARVNVGDGGLTDGTISDQKNVGLFLLCSRCLNHISDIFIN